MDKSKRKMGLGKGLDVIFASKPSKSNEGVMTEKWDLNLDEIEMNPYQPRSNFDKVALDELKSSIQNQGIIQPIAVRKLKNGKYQLISGERRYQASKLAGLSSIPAYVREATDIQMLEMGIIENIQRENLNPVELALSFKRLLLECNIKQEELATRVGKDRSTVNNYLRLLQLPQMVLDGLTEKKLTMGHARTLLSLNDFNVPEKPFILVFDRPSDRGNFGSLIRSANSFGVDAIFVVGHGIDACDPKVIRSSLGSIFHSQIVYIDSMV